MPVRSQRRVAKLTVPVCTYLVNQGVGKDIIVGGKLRKGQSMFLRIFHLRMVISRHDIMLETVLYL